MDYQKAYVYLFNAITDALEEMQSESYEYAAERLKEAQLHTEEWYIEEGERDFW